MIALYIVSGIIIVFAILLAFSITIYVKITDEVSILVGAFGYKQSIDFDKDDAEEKEKTKKKKKSSKLDDASKKVSDKKANEKSLSQTLDFAITLIKSIFPNSMRMLKHIRITSLKLCMTVACEDADQTAIAYGVATASIHTLLGVLDNTFKLNIKSVDIAPDFVSGEAKYDISFKVKLRFVHMLFASIGIIVKIIVNTMKNKKSVKVKEQV
ncbi:MAG: DUF2953 domain-containing protein [Oscillospiraceae bacterium]